MARISGSETFRPNDFLKTHNNVAERISETLPVFTYEQIGFLDGGIVAADTSIELDELALRTIAANDYLRIGDEIVQVSAVTSQQEFTITRGELGTTAAQASDGAEVDFVIIRRTTSEVTLGALMSGRPSEGNIVGVIVFEPEDSSTNFTADLEISPDNENWEVNESYTQANLVDSVDVAATMYHRINLKTNTAGKTVKVNFRI